MNKRSVIPRKIILVGDTCVGKTSIYCAYKGMPLPKSSTIVAEVFNVDVKYLGQTIPLALWDTGGDERFQAITPIYFRSCACAVLVYDQSTPNTFEKMKNWHLKLINEYAITNFIVAANKCDLPENLPFSKAKSWCRENGIRIIRTSAENNINIANLFLAVGEIVAESDVIVQNCVDLEVERMQRANGKCCNGA